MPTTVTKVIGTGGDYTTIQGWEDALPADLVSGDTLQRGQCKNQTFSENVTISGQTTDSTRYVVLECQTGASFKDNANVRTNALVYNTSNGMALAGNVPLTVGTNYTRLIGLQVRNNSSYGLALDISALVTNVLAQKCIFKNGTGAFKTVTSRDPSNIIANCLIECPGASNDGGNSQGQFYNCTFAVTTGSPTGTGVTSGYSNVTLKNCAVFGFSTAESGTLHAGSSNNATDKSSVGGSSGDVTSLTYSSQFVSSTNDFRAVSSGGLKAGTPDSTNAPDDITGLTRDATTPYIGCWEVAATSSFTPPRPLTLLQSVPNAVSY